VATESSTRRRAIPLSYFPSCSTIGSAVSSCPLEPLTTMPSWWMRVVVLFVMVMMVSVLMVEWLFR
ncbi:hypothetical protein Tsubulata_039359, partial [Turnera subulata]